MEIKFQAVNQIEIIKQRNNWFTVVIRQSNGYVSGIFEVQDAATAIAQLNKRGQTLSRDNRSTIKCFIK